MPHPRVRRLLSLVLTPVITAAAVGIGMVALAPPASAETLIVSTPTDKDDGICGNPGAVIPSLMSLREALCLGAQLSGANVVQVPPGTYQLTLGDIDIVPTLGTSLTVLGSGAGQTQIVGNIDGDRVLDIAGPASGSFSVTLSSLTVRGGRSYNGGGAGIRAGSGPGSTLNVTVEDSIISGNSSAQGFNSVGAPVFGGDGGGIAAIGANLTLTSTTISNNTSGQNGGGGVAFAAGALTITDSTFSNNQTITNAATTSGGGALSVGSDSTATVNRSTFTNNQADGVGLMAGGAIESFATALTVSRSTFTGNSTLSSVSGRGGAIAVQAGVSTLQYNRIRFNSATTSGNGVAQLGTAVVNAENNWWGCNAGPGSAGCSTTSGTVDSDPRIVLTHTASPASVAPNATSTLTASMATNSAGSAIAQADLVALVGLGVSFGNASGGTLSNAGTALSANGTATATFTAGSQPGPASADATVDGQAATASLQVEGAVAPTVTVNQSNGQADPTDASPISFTAVFSEPVSGFDATGVDLSASTATGTLAASVTGGPSEYTISVSGMTGAGDVVASIPSGSATSEATGESNVASTSTDNTVSWAPPAKKSQTITFTLPSSATYGNAPITLTGSASSGLPVTYSVAPDEDACSVSGTTLTILHAGTCTVTAAQAGNDEYDAAASVTDDLRIRQLFVSLFLRAPSQLMYAEAARLEVTALHGNTPASVTYSTTTPALCEVFNGRVGGVKALAASGTCEVSVEAEDTRDIAYGTDTAQITLIKANQSISFGALPDRTFGEPDFAVSATASSGLPVSFSAAGDCTVTANQVHLTDAGTCTITASQAGDDNYNAATPVGRTFAISPAFTLTTPDDVQYSDRLTLQATVTGGISGSVEFDVDGADFCTATIDTGTGDASCSAVINLSAGTYDVEATLVPDAATFGSSSASGQVSVLPEDATTEYAGETFVSTGSATASSVNVPLRALVAQAADDSLGDITRAKVEFQLFRSSNFTGTPNVRVPAVIDANGVATATATGLPVDNYVVRVALLDDTPQYFDGPLSESVVLTVYAPTSGVWATGGGWVIDPGTNNLPVAINPDNDRGSLGFSVRYKKGTTTPQGQSVYVFRGADGYDYVVKSNSWRGGGAAFRSTTTGGTAAFSGRASVQVFDPATGLIVSGLGGGNFTYRVDVSDAGKTDSYAISVYGAQNRLYHQAGTPSSQLPLQGGNITVHPK